MTQSQIPPLLLTPGTRHLTPLRLTSVPTQVQKWAAKPSRFNRLQSDPDMLMKTKGRNGTVKSFMKENATLEKGVEPGGFAPRPPGFSAWVPG